MQIAVSLSLILYSLATFNPIMMPLALCMLLACCVTKLKELSPAHLLVFFVTLIFPILFNVLFSIEHIYINSVVKYVMFVLYVFLMLQLSRYDHEVVEKAFVHCLLLHLVFFYIQVVAYFATGEFIEFSKYVRAKDAVVLYESKALMDSFISARFTGLFTEPSYYSMVALPISAIFLILNKHKLLSVFGIISVGLSLSIAAIIIMALMIGIYIVLSKGNKYLKVLCVVAAILLTPVFYGFYDARINAEADYDAIASRSHVFTEFQVRNAYLNMVGEGVFIDEAKPLGIVGLTGAEIRDSSFYIYLLYSVGLFGFLTFFALMFYLFGFKSMVYLMPLLLFKYHLLSTMFFMTLFLFYFYKEEVSHFAEVRECEI